MSSSAVASGLSMVYKMASSNSPKLCGGIFVAIPTAIPSLPLSNKVGTRVGRTEGSRTVSS